MTSILYRSPWLLASRGIRCSARPAKDISHLKATAAFSTRPARQAEEVITSAHVDENSAGLGQASLDPRTEPVGSKPSQTFANPPTNIQPELPDISSQDTMALATANAGQIQADGAVRWPRAVQAVFLKPLRRDITHGHPSCDLQMRSYSVRNLDFFTDFALRAAYYLKLPAFGPVPLPRIVERWTVPKSNFVHKKSQENFERRTVRRLIQIKDGHPDTVDLWLSYLRKHAFHGIGMKANVYTFGTYNPPKPKMQEKKADAIASPPKSAAVLAAKPGASSKTARFDNAAKVVPQQPTKAGAPRKASATPVSTKSAASSPRPANRTNPIQAKPLKPVSGSPAKPVVGGRKR